VDHERLRYRTDKDWKDWVLLDKDLLVISGFLARRDIPCLELPEPADVLVLMGSAVLESVEVAARALHSGATRRILVSGGIGHSTPHLYAAVARHPTYRVVAVTGRPESHIIGDILQDHLGVDPTSIQFEDASSNCGENAELSRRKIQAAASIVLVQDPTMQRRTHAAFERSFCDSSSTRLISFAPVQPWIGASGVSAEPGGPPIWSRERFTSLVLGEVRRLRDDADGYGPLGRNFIDHVDIPEQVLLAYRNVAGRRPDLIRPAGG
jgi:uncharacterized SAM-binding protein YcdF (DUF218 family)